MEVDTATTVVRGECVNEAAETPIEPFEPADLYMGWKSTECMTTTVNILNTLAVVCEVLAHMVTMTVEHH